MKRLIIIGCFFVGAFAIADSTNITSSVSQATIQSATLYQLPDGGIAANCNLAWPVTFSDGGLFMMGACNVQVAGGSLSTTIGQVANACTTQAQIMCGNFK